MCHREGCPKHAAVATVTSRQSRTVKGYPRKFCSQKCVALAHGPRAHRRMRQTLGEFQLQTGLLSMTDAEKRLDRSRLTIGVLARKLGVGRQLEGVGPGAWFFTEEELSLIEHRMMRAPTASIHTDLRRRGAWYHTRFGSTSMYGRLGASSGHLGASAGIEAGRLKGGRPPASTREQQDEMRRLLAQGVTLREVAERVFGDPALYARVHRFRQAMRRQRLLRAVS
jgi:hypothetical protein